MTINSQNLIYYKKNEEEESILFNIHGKYS